MVETVPSEVQIASDSFLYSKVHEVSVPLAIMLTSIEVGAIFWIITLGTGQLGAGSQFI